jgi:hypothetical protein
LIDGLFGAILDGLAVDAKPETGEMMNNFGDKVAFI